MMSAQAWSRPTKPRPIVIIGTGGIVNDAHLPAYRKASFPVAGVFDIDRERAEKTAARFGVQRVFDSIAEATAQRNVVFDIAVPPEKTHGLLEVLPDAIMQIR